jgi:hypothetical protein
MSTLERVPLGSTNNTHHAWYDRYSIPIFVIGLVVAVALGGNVDALEAGIDHIIND